MHFASDTKSFSSNGAMTTPKATIITKSFNIPENLCTISIPQRTLTCHSPCPSFQQQCHDVPATQKWRESEPIKHAKSGFDQRDPSQLEKQGRMSKCNAKLIEYSSQANKLPLWGVLGAPDGRFSGKGTLSNSLASICLC